MNTEIRTEAKNYIEKDLFKLINNSVLGKTTDNGRKHKDIKLGTTNRGRRHLMPEPNTTKLFSEILLPAELNRAEVKLNNPTY